MLGVQGSSVQNFQLTVYFILFYAASETVCISYQQYCLMNSWLPGLHFILWNNIMILPQIYL